MRHLVIEKLLKAIYVKNVDNNPPRIHDLLRLAEKSQIYTTDFNSSRITWERFFCVVKKRGLHG